MFYCNLAVAHCWVDQASNHENLLTSLHRRRKQIQSGGAEPLVLYESGEAAI